jgi:outer membrane receptor for monomeric catechols
MQAAHDARRAFFRESVRGRPKSMRLPKRLLLLPAFAAALAAGARGQTQPAAGGDVTTLEPLEVSGVPADASVNPLAQQTSDVLGDGRGPLDTPRAETVITSGLFDDRGLSSVSDLSAYSPGAYTPSEYGRATTPYIRGDIAETYVNGQRISENAYGYVPSFNGVGSVDLVEGPGSAVYGGGNYQGGYVNYVTKQPQFSGPFTVVTSTLGDWVPGGGSYFDGSVQVDHNQTVSKTLAWRLSYEAQDDATYYQASGDRDDREDAYAALAWEPNPRLTVEASAQFFWEDSPEVLGINRVNQQLIWSGTYFTGVSADNSDFPGPIPATGTSALPRAATLLSPGDYANADVARAQAVATLDLGPSLTLVNRTLFEDVDRRSYYQFEYDEWATQETFEDRLELHGDLKDAGLPQTWVGGLTLRWESRLSYVNYFNEYAYNFDLTGPSRTFNEAQQFPSSYDPGQPGPGGRLFFGEEEGTPDSTDSRLWNPAVFWQHDLQLAKRLSLLLGARGEGFLATAQDPLPPPGTIPWRDSAQAWVFSNDESLVFRPSRWASLYATWQQIHNVNGSEAGGGVMLDGSGKIDPGDLRNLSDLAEAGAKFSFLDDRLYATATVFDQARTQIEQGDVHNDIRLRGLELEAVYQPTARLNATANATFQRGWYVDSAPFQFGGQSIYDAYALGRGPGGLGTSTGDFNPYGDQLPIGDYPMQALSHTMLNGSVSYRWRGGFGVGGDLQWQSWQSGNIGDQWHIPAQYTLDANVSYRTGRWEVDVDFLNLTDRHNWIANGDAYTDSQLIFQELPFRVGGRMRYRF